VFDLFDNVGQKVEIGQKVQNLKPIRLICEIPFGGTIKVKFKVNEARDSALELSM